MWYDAKGYNFAWLVSTALKRIDGDEPPPFPRNIESTSSSKSDRTFVDIYNEVAGESTSTSADDVPRARSSGEPSETIEPAKRFVEPSSDEILNVESELLARREVVYAYIYTSVDEGLFRCMLLSLKKRVVPHDDGNEDNAIDDPSESSFTPDPLRTNRIVIFEIESFLRSLLVREKGILECRFFRNTQCCKMVPFSVRDDIFTHYEITEITLRDCHKLLKGRRAHRLLALQPIFQRHHVLVIPFKEYFTFVLRELDKCGAQRWIETVTVDISRNTVNDVLILNIYKGKRRDDYIEF